MYGTRSLHRFPYHRSRRSGWVMIIHWNPLESLLHKGHGIRKRHFLLSMAWDVSNFCPSFRPNRKYIGNSDFVHEFHCLEMSKFRFLHFSSQLYNLSTGLPTWIGRKLNMVAVCHCFVIFRGFPCNIQENVLRMIIGNISFIWLSLGIPSLAASTVQPCNDNTTIITNFRPILTDENDTYWPAYSFRVWSQIAYERKCWLDVLMLIS